jgi:hypothetical protein
MSLNSFEKVMLVSVGSQLQFFAAIFCGSLNNPTQTPVYHTEPALDRVML